MEKKRGNPGLLIAVAMLMLVTGGFFTVLQVGMDARRGTGIQGGFGYRGEAGGKERAESSYIDDLKRGSDVIKTRASDLFGDIFGGGSQAPQGEYASANGGRGYRGYSADEIAGKYAPEDDAFEKYYKENYGSGSSDYSPSSSYGGDAGTFYGGGGGGGGSYQEVARGGSSGGGKTSADGEGGAGETPALGQGGPQGAPQGGGSGQPSQLYASLPAKGADRAYGGLPGPGGAAGGGDGGPSFDGGGAGHGKQGGKAGGLDAFRGGGGAKDLDGALEGGRNSGAASYGANMSKSAAGVAAGGSAGAGGSGGGAVPKASEAEKVSSAGGGSSSSSSSSSSPGGSSNSSGYSNEDYDSTYYGGGTAPQNRTADAPLLKDIVNERRNGAEDKYVTPEEAQEGVDKSLLASGASPKDTMLKGLSEEKKPQPDPDSFGALTDTRKEELKKEVHVLLKRVETDYGSMKDIQFYGCSAYPEVCKAHGLTENFLTMTTATGATITLGVKYVSKRWRTYTLDFKDPSGAKPAASGKPGAIQTGVYGGDEEDEEEEEE